MPRRLGLLGSLMMMVALPVLLGSGSRLQQARSPQPVDTSNERYVHDLLGQDKSDRLYAARTLRSRLRVALRDAESREGTLRQLDAIAALDDFDELVAPACAQALELRNVAHHCAWMIGRLGYEPAIPILEAVVQPESQANRRLRRQASTALEALAPPPPRP
jgi:hypothetical protein